MVLKRFFQKKPCGFVHQLVVSRTQVFFSSSPMIHYVSVPKQIKAGVNILWNPESSVLDDFLTQLPVLSYETMGVVVLKTKDQSRKVMCEIADRIQKQTKMQVVADQVAYEGDLSDFKGWDVVLIQYWQPMKVVNTLWQQY